MKPEFESQLHHKCMTLGQSPKLCNLISKHGDNQGKTHLTGAEQASD